MQIKYCIKTILLFCFFLTVSTQLMAEELSGDYTTDCVDESIISEEDRSPDYNLLSFPAVSTDDPYIVAASYFNSKLSVIVREDFVSQYEYSNVPYYIYKSFINSGSVKDYYNRCIKNVYESVKVY